MALLRADHSCRTRNAAVLHHATGTLLSYACGVLIAISFAQSSYGQTVSSQSSNVSSTVYNSNGNTTEIPLPLSNATGPTVGNVSAPRTSSQRTANRTGIDTAERWANAVFHYVKNLNCSKVLFTTQRECTHLTHLRRQKTNIYVAGPSEYGRLQAFLPDGQLGQGAHNGIVVLDPYPQASFGHFVLIFFVDMDWPRQLCTHFKGKYVEENGECFTLALRTKCVNSINRYRSRDRPDRSREEDLNPVRIRKRERRFAKKCEVHFLPTVKYEHSSSIVVENLLKCRDDLPHFASCPLTRQINETSGIVCDPLRLNHGRCETSHYLVGLDSCSQLTRCDHAVMIGGGWNHLTSLEDHKKTFLDMYRFFRANGFNRKKIAPFFGNGLPQGIPLDDTGYDGDEPVPIYPAAMKSAISSRIRHLCAEPYCVETLVIYLSTPATADGQMLLWDLNGNGQAEDNEKYSIEELMRDTEECNAVSVQIIADQSFSGKITKSIKKYHASTHTNTIVFSSSKETEYSFNNDFTNHWISLDHSHSCSRNIFQHIKDHRIMTSNPEVEGQVDLTIFGAQCNVDPQYTEYELSTYHRGCQYLPSMIVLQGHAAAARRRRSSSSLSNIVSKRQNLHSTSQRQRAKRKVSNR